MCTTDHDLGSSSFWTRLSSCPFRADSAGGPDVQKTVVVPKLQFSDLVETCPLLRRHVQFSNKVLTCPLLRRQVQFSDTVVDMPVGVQRQGSRAQWKASDSIHCRSLQTFHCASETGLHLWGSWLVKLRVSQSPVQSDATNIIFLSRALFVCSVVSRWCACCAWCAVLGAVSACSPTLSFGIFASWTLPVPPAALAFSISPAGRRGGRWRRWRGGTFFKAARGGRRDAHRGRVHCGGASDPVHRQSVPRVVS